MAFQKYAVIFSIWFVLSVLAVAALEAPAPNSPSQAPNPLASFQAMLMGFVGVAISFIFFKSVA